MLELFKLLFNICLFKKEPKDIPESNGVLYLIVSVYAVIKVLIFLLDPANTLFQALVEILLILGLSWGILWVSRKKFRYLQTVSALVGTEAVISFFATANTAIQESQSSQLAFFIIITLMLWHLAVTGYIFSKALDQSFFFGLGVSFIYILLSYQGMAWIFPEIFLVKEGV